MAPAFAKASAGPARGPAFAELRCGRLPANRGFERQWRWGRPDAQAQQPPPPPLPSHAGASLAPVLEANTENFLVILVEPQCGHFVPFQSEERTRISLSLSHFPQ